MHHSSCEYQVLLKTMDQRTDKGRPTPDFHWGVTGPGVRRLGVGRGEGRSIWLWLGPHSDGEGFTGGQRGAGTSTCRIHMKFLCVLKPRCLRGNRDSAGRVLEKHMNRGG